MKLFEYRPGMGLRIGRLAFQWHRPRLIALLPKDPETKVIRWYLCFDRL